MSSLYYSDLCRLCLVKNRDSIPIFDGEGYMRRIFLKISTCLPLKVSREDQLPKNICADCMCRVENQFQFWNTVIDSEKQLFNWLRNTPVHVNEGPLPQFSAIEMKPMELTHDSDINNPSLELSKSVEAALSRVEAALEAEDEDESEDECSTSDDEDDNNVGENESDETGERELEPTTFVNVSLACEQPGPSVPLNIPAQPADSPAMSAAGISSLQLSGEASKQASDIASAELTEFLCTYPRCGKTFWHLSLFNAHVNSHELSLKLAKRYRCMQCGTTFSTLLEIETHQQSAHPILLGDDKLGPNDAQNSRPRVHYQHTCSICNTAYATYEALTSHLNTHGRQRNIAFLDRRPFQCDICKKVFLEPSHLKSHKVSHSSERPYQCGVCNKTFKRKAILVKHAKTHTGIKEHACCYCSYATVHKTNLEYHKMRRHSQAFEFTCDICGKRFKAPGDLKSHIVTHEERRFKCMECDKAFHFNHLLVAHQRTHNPNRFRLQCELCGKSYSQKSSLTDHISRYHLGHTYKCDICTKVVTTPESLIIHRRRHTGEKPFVCEVCHKPFISKKLLSVHRLVHTGDKPHKCQECGKCFSQRSTLVVHMRYHSGLRPYACELCPKSFVTKTLLTAHCKTHSMDCRPMTMV